MPVRKIQLIVLENSYCKRLQSSATKHMYWEETIDVRNIAVSDAIRTQFEEIFCYLHLPKITELDVNDKASLSHLWVLQKNVKNLPFVKNIAVYESVVSYFGRNRLK